jgi:hypothetical protein
LVLFRWAEREPGINKVSRNRIVVKRERKGAIEYEFEELVGSQFSKDIGGPGFGFGSGSAGLGVGDGIGWVI